MVVSRWADTPRRRFFLGLRLAVLVLLAVDLARPPAAQLSARGMLAVIDLYQATLSPRLGRVGARCRFQPTCSHYGAAVIRRHGALVGGVKTAWRILRCGPWTPAGTEDPPEPGWKPTGFSLLDLGNDDAAQIVPRVHPPRP